MLAFVGQFFLERRVEMTDNKIAVVFVLHQFFDPTHFQPTNSSTFQHSRRYLL